MKDVELRGGGTAGGYRVFWKGRYAGTVWRMKPGRWLALSCYFQTRKAAVAYVVNRLRRDIGRTFA